MKNLIFDCGLWNDNSEPPPTTTQVKFIYRFLNIFFEIFVKGPSLRSIFFLGGGVGKGMTPLPPLCWYPMPMSELDLLEVHYGG
jgi:hypothetical protein